MPNPSSMNLKEWWAFAENLARTNEDIGHTDEECHYARMTFAEMFGANFTKLKSPALIADTPEDEGVAPFENHMTQKYLAWTIIKRLTKQGDFDELKNAEDDCERIAKQVLMKVHRQKLAVEGTKVQPLADVLMQEWQGDVVSAMFAAGTWAGFRIMVPVQTTDHYLKYDAGKWDDDAAAPLKKDLTGISCANLNDPTLGLTAGQRLDCLGVNVKDSDGNLVARVAAGDEYILEDDASESSSGSCPAGTANLKNTDDEDLGSTDVPSGEAVAIVAPNATIRINAVVAATVPSGNIRDLLLQDQDGDPLDFDLDGAIITVTMQPTFLYYTDEAAALADTTTIPTVQQRVVLTDAPYAGREYRGLGGATTVADLISAKKFMLPVVETEKGINTTVQNTEVGIQLTDPT